jgi:hypothetical protein
MAACNAAGGMLGAKLAILRGNTFIRVFLLFSAISPSVSAIISDVIFPNLTSI